MKKTQPGKNVLIYGATGGIGSAIADKMQSLGFALFLIGRSAKKMNQLVQQLGIQSSQTFCTPSITRASDLEKTEHWICSKKVQFSVGIHASGYGVFKQASQIGIEEWQSVIDANLNSAFSFYHLIDKFRDDAGIEFVFFGSAGTDEIWPKNALYGASKAGLEMFARVIQKEERARNGRVWLYKPGSVDTAFFSNVKSHLPKKKMIKPADLAEIVVSNFETSAEIIYPTISMRSDT